MLRRRWLWLLPPLLGAAPLGAATLTDLSAPVAEEAPAAPTLAVGEVYAEGAFALVYAGPETGLKEGDRVPVRRYGRVVGHWVVTHVARDITRGRFEAREAGEVMKPTDTLDLASRQMAPATAPAHPPVAFAPSPGMGASLFAATPFVETGTALGVNFARTQNLIESTGFAMDADLATTTLRLTPRRGYSLGFSRQQAELTSTLGTTSEIHTQIWSLAYTRDKPAKSLSSRVFPSVGVAALRFDTGEGGFDETRLFSYATLAAHQGAGHAYAGVGFVGGTGYGASRPSLLLGLRRTMGRRLGLGAGYASRDYLKEATLNRRLPYESARLGLPLPLVCEGCRNDALSLSLDYALGDGRTMTLGVYDALDLAAPSLSVESRF